MSEWRLKPTLTTELIGDRRISERGGSREARETRNSVRVMGIAHRAHHNHPRHGVRSQRSMRRRKATGAWGRECPSPRRAGLVLPSAVRAW